jgi:hypothetical protein
MIDLPRLVESFKSGVSQEDPELSSLPDVERSTPQDHESVLMEIEGEEEASEDVSIIKEGIMPNEEAVEQMEEDYVEATLEVEATRQADDGAAARRMEEYIRREEAKVEAERLAADKSKNEIAWKEAKTRQIAVEAREKLQMKLQSSLKAAIKYNEMVRVGTSNSKKGPKLKKKAEKRNQIEKELEEIDRLLSMVSN